MTRSGGRRSSPRASGGARHDEAQFDSFDAVPGASPNAPVSVHTLTTAAKDLVEGAFPPLWVRGEVSDFKSHRNGHWYFSLRDADAQVRCVVWNRDQRGIPAAPDDGMAVIALGQMTVWPVRGDLQFSIKAMDAAGDGLWRKALEQTRSRLEQDGLLSAERKRPLPRYPRRIAVITSMDGAAVHDIVSVTRTRNDGVEIVVIPAKVQGEGAPESLVAAIERLCRWQGADLLIIGRGGGAREDLWAFNDERVARALAACPIPTVSAVGHEVDVTICDLVADVRAATPSAAAELAIPTKREMRERIAGWSHRLAAATQWHAERGAESLDTTSGAFRRAAARYAESRRGRLELLAGRLHALSPLGTLARGFAVARSSTGATLHSVDAFSADFPFLLQLRDGIVHARTEGVERVAIGTRHRTTTSDIPSARDVGHVPATPSTDPVS